MQSETPVRQMALDLSAPEQPTLANFIVAGNVDALSILKQVALGEGPQFLYLWGEFGSGKTHLLRAIDVLYSTHVVPIFDVSRTLYTVDDIERLDAIALEDLFHLMNAIRNHPNCRLVVTGSVPIQALDIREDVKSRLAWGLSYEIRFLDEDAARDEFVRQAKARGIEVTPDMNHWIASHCPRDMQGLRNLLDAIDRYALEKKRRVTLPLLSEFVHMKESR